MQQKKNTRHIEYRNDPLGHKTVHNHFGIKKKNHCKNKANGKKSEGKIVEKAVAAINFMVSQKYFANFVLLHTEDIVPSAL